MIVRLQLAVLQPSKNAVIRMVVGVRITQI